MGFSDSGRGMADKVNLSEGCFFRWPAWGGRSIPLESLSNQNLRRGHGPRAL